MRICITSQGDNLESKLDPRFGRCMFFIIWDSATKDFLALPNPNIDVGSGAGIQSAQLVVDQQVQTVITGDVGPKAKNVLQLAGINIVTGMNSGMTIREILQNADNSNNLEENSSSNNLNSITKNQVNTSNDNNVDDNDRVNYANKDASQNSNFNSKPNRTSNVFVRGWNRIFGRNSSLQNNVTLTSPRKFFVGRRFASQNSADNGLGMRCCGFGSGSGSGSNRSSGLGRGRKNVVGTGVGRGRGCRFDNNSVASNFSTTSTDICVCPVCGATQQHQLGIPCREIKCSQCNATMVRG